MRRSLTDLSLALSLGDVQNRSWQIRDRAVQALDEGTLRLPLGDENGSARVARRRLPRLSTIRRRVRNR